MFPLNSDDDRQGQVMFIRFLLPFQLHNHILQEFDGYFCYSVFLHALLDHNRCTEIRMMMVKDGVLLKTFSVFKHMIFWHAQIQRLFICCNHISYNTMQVKIYNNILTMKKMHLYLNRIDKICMILRL